MVLPPEIDADGAVLVGKERWRRDEEKHGTADFMNQQKIAKRLKVNEFYCCMSMYV